MTRPKQSFKPRACVICGKVFRPSSTRAKTCSPKCSAEYHRRFCFATAREQAFLKPYDIEAFLAKKAAAEEAARLKALSKPQPPPPPPDKTPEPTTPAEREEQLASVNRTMSLPPSQRYQHSRIWSDFQRLAAIAIEKRRISDHYALAEYFNPYHGNEEADTPADPPPEPDLPRMPPAPKNPSTYRPSAATVPTLPPNLKSRQPK